jgi:hypothetical protein
MLRSGEGAKVQADGGQIGNNSVGSSGGHLNRHKEKEARRGPLTLNQHYAHSDFIIGLGGLRFALNFEDAGLFLAADPLFVSRADLVFVGLRG